MNDDSGISVDGDELGILLFNSVVKNNVASTRELLENGAEVNFRDSRGSSSLHFAASFGFSSVLSLLLEQPDADVRAKDEHGRTPLQAAAFKGQTDAARLLLEKGAKVTDVDSAGQSAIEYAAERGCVELMALLMEFSSVETVVGGALHASAFYGNVDLVNFLLEKGAVCCSTNADGDTVLHTAARAGKSDVVELLVRDWKMDVASKGAGSMTPLRIAVELDQHQVVRCLLENGADLYETDACGAMAVHIAAYFGCLTTLKLLVEDFNCELDVRKQPWGRTALHLAVENQQLEATRFLIQAGADVNGHDWLGDSTIHIAGCNCRSILEMLIRDYRAEVNLRGKNGRTLLHIAARKNDVDLARFLVDDCGADVDVLDNRHFSSFGVAYMFGHDQVVDVFLANWRKQREKTTDKNVTKS